MKLIKTEDAVGHVLCHDITQIIRGVTKDAVFRKGHIVREEDIPVLLRIGKEHLYIWENDERMLHENEAAKVLYDICKNEHMRPSEIKEGKIELIAECDGLFVVDPKKLYQINALGEMMIACRHGNFPVRAGDKLAGMRVIPLVIEKEKMQRARQAAGQSPIFALKPFLKKTAGIVTTGSEVFNGRIEDAFTPVIKEKLAEYNVSVIGHELSDDDPKRTADAILKLADQGAEMIICTGGMSVDPDDQTPAAIRSAAGSVVTYGAPVLPGAMFLLAYMEKTKIPVLGLPGCVMYAKRTIFDLVLPRILAGETLTADDFARMGEGGLCLSCPVCTFPSCGFGKCGSV
ncbi:MAG: molybdopterin-binding protein [Eubacterium sp.]|nr:molybdopterin-binding protein [Eubacterium sp.]